MAYVPTTRGNLSDVSENIRRMRHAELNHHDANAALVTKMRKSTELAAYLYDKAWATRADLADLRDRLRVLDKEVPVIIAVFSDDADPDAKQIMHANFQMIMPAHIVVANAGNYYTTVSIRATLSELPADIRADIERMVEHYQRWDKVEDQVRTFLEKCKSFNEALKVWPDLAVFLPKGLLARVESKKEKDGPKSEAAKALEQMDTDTLMTSFVKSKIAAGS